MAQGHQHALGDALGIGFAGQIAKQGDEFVAAETGQVVTRPQTSQQPLRHFHQHLVASAVAEAVVDQLEAVQIDEEQGRGPTVRSLLHLLEQFVQVQTVGQAGQGIVACRMAQAFLGGLACADVGLRTGHAQSSLLAALGDAAHQHPQVVTTLDAHAVFMGQRRRSPVQVIGDRLAQPRQVVRMYPLEPAAAGIARLRRHAQHGGPALGQVQLVVLHVPFPDAVLRAAQRARQPRLAVLQGVPLSGAVGVDGEDHVEEDDLQQAVVQPVLLVVAEQRAQHFRQVEAIGTEVPFQVDADPLMDQPHQQAVTHVVALVGTVPQAPVVFLLALLEPRQPGAVTVQGGWLAEVGEVFVELVDEGAMSRVQLARGAVQAQRVAGLPLQEALAGQDLFEAQPHSLQQRLQLVFHPRPLLPCRTHAPENIIQA